jgi:hypothetical protein
MAWCSTALCSTALYLRRGALRAGFSAGFSVVLVVSVVALLDDPVYAATKSAQRPSAANTGVPPGTTLTKHDGDITVTKAGTVLKDLDIHGFVIVKASNVTIESSIVRGGVSHGDTALVKVSSGTNVLVEDTELVPEDPSVQIDGIRGANYTVLRDNIHGTTDGSKVTGDNVTITDSYVHDLPYWAHDPDQGGNPAHNDGVEIFVGKNLHITDNTFDIASYGNSAMQVNQNLGTVTNLHFTGNYADGGHCTVNLSDHPKSSMTGIQVDNNRFGRDTSIVNCAILAKRAVSFTHVNDVWDDTGSPVTIRLVS